MSGSQGSGVRPFILVGFLAIVIACAIMTFLGIDAPYRTYLEGRRLVDNAISGAPMSMREIMTLMGGMLVIVVLVVKLAVSR